MGREIRRVPMGWEHPKTWKGGFQPLYDREFEQEADEWRKGFFAWEDGTHKDLIDHPECKTNYPYFWVWHGDPPDPDYYRQKWPNDAIMGFAVYETVTEGTPITPTFLTEEELIDHLVINGTDWDDGKGWSREHAEGFVKQHQWEPSAWISLPKEMDQL